MLLMMFMRFFMFNESTGMKYKARSGAKLQSLMEWSGTTGHCRHSNDEYNEDERVMMMGSFFPASITAHLKEQTTV